MLRAIDRSIAGIVRSHRFIFITSTVVLAIGTSRVADNVCEWSSWLLTTGAAFTMYISDLCGDIERKASDLSRPTSKPLVKTRVDVFRSEAPPWAFAALVIGVILLAVGFVFTAVS